MADQQYIVAFACAGDADYKYSKPYRTHDAAIRAAARMLVQGAAALVIYQSTSKGKWRVSYGKAANQV